MRTPPVFSVILVASLGLVAAPGAGQLPVNACHVGLTLEGVAVLDDTDVDPNAEDEWTISVSSTAGHRTLQVTDDGQEPPYQLATPWNPDLNFTIYNVANESAPLVLDLYVLENDTTQDGDYRLLPPGVPGAPHAPAGRPEDGSGGATEEGVCPAPGEPPATVSQEIEVVGEGGADWWDREHQHAGGSYVPPFLRQPLDETFELRLAFTWTLQGESVGGT